MLGRLLVHFAWVILVANTSTAFAAGNYQDAVRCSYTWLAVKNSGQNLGRQDLLSYGTERMAWYSGFIRGQEGNAAFANYVVQTAQQFILLGAKMSYALDEGWKTGNRSLYNSVIREAIGCDQTMEVRPVVTNITYW